LIVFSTVCGNKREGWVLHPLILVANSKIKLVLNENSQYYERENLIRHQPTGCATSFHSSFIWLGSIPHGFSCFKKAEVSLIPCQSKAQALNEPVEVVLATWDIRSQTRRLHQPDFPFLSL
jgi:hypothetical protein